MTNENVSNTDNSKIPISNPAKLPHVPGAGRIRPEPKPRAKK